MFIDSDPKLDFHNVLIEPRISNLTSRSSVCLEREFNFRSNVKWKGVPIIASNMDSTGTFEIYDKLSKHKCLTALHKFYNRDDFVESIEKRERLDSNYYMVSTGISERDYIKMCEIVDMTDALWICIDVANGHMTALVDFCKKVRMKYPNKIIVAGNVVTAEMTKILIEEGGVDIVKVGIGSGAACITRMKAGVGMPQLSAVIECAKAAKKLGGYIISDGGITCPGDMAKAFCGGADFVMCGGVFSGHDENPGEIIEENGIKYKLFYGMSSEHAMNKYYGGMEKYRSSEGRVLKVKYKGTIEETLLDYLGGLRSCCTYIDAGKIEEMYRQAIFVMVSQQMNLSLVN